jgi:hypothetical protein
LPPRVSATLGLYSGFCKLQAIIMSSQTVSGRPLYEHNF